MAADLSTAVNASRSINPSGSRTIPVNYQEGEAVSLLPFSFFFLRIVSPAHPQHLYGHPSVGRLKEEKTGSPRFFDCLSEDGMVSLVFDFFRLIQNLEAFVVK
jgi:hypothetical protein